MGVLKNFLNSEKAVASGALVVVASVLVFMTRITPQEWMDYTQVVLGIYVGGKTVQGAVGAVTSASQHREEAQILRNRLAAVEEALDDGEEEEEEEEEEDGGDDE